MIKSIGKMVASVVVAAVLLTAALNISPAFAQKMSDIPVIGGVVRVLTFRQYTVDEKRFKADIKVPQIKGLTNETLKNSLNEKYLGENKKLYNRFMTEMQEMKKNKSGNYGVASGYTVITDNDVIFSVRRYVVKVQASGMETAKYDTIDKKKQILITLPSLFKDNSYVDVISKNITDQMQQQMTQDNGMMYWIDNSRVPKEVKERFNKISGNQNFYINKDNKLVISFDEYEVGPGSMGTPEFIIPTEVIANILVGNEYIK